MLQYFFTTATAASIVSQIAVSSASFYTSHCKTSPQSSAWPCTADWQALNRTVSGRLLKPLPPASICHANEPDFELAACNATDWTNSATYANDPVGIINPNWSNDSCLPQPAYLCSGAGFPIYVVNASSAEHVAAGVSFARGHNIRLNVKGSGHDYLGRSVAANSLSIWTKHIRGFEYSSNFRPTHCQNCDAIPALTLGAGEDWGDIYAAAHAYNVTFVGGTGDTIGLGGYLTGGGHSPLSAILGLAADQVLEMEIVLASGEVVVANEVMHTDLFWAMRGVYQPRPRVDWPEADETQGGGAIFGIMTSVTIKAFPEMPMPVLIFQIAAPPSSEAFWNASTFFVSSAPRLADDDVMSYSYLSPGIDLGGTLLSGVTGAFTLPNGTAAELTSAVAFVDDYVGSIPGVNVSFVGPIQYPSVYEWYQNSKNTDPIGRNQAIGGRLLDAKALSNVTALRAAMERANPVGTLGNLNAVAGPGLWNAKPAGGSDAVLPAWRKSYIEYEVPVFWPFLNSTAEDMQRHLLTNVYVEALRELAPDTGSYINEGDANEPNFQEAFWGAHYPRLLSIKRALDPTDLFWCKVCVGSEGWKEEDGVLCRV